jgi:hypothetical protein
VLKAWIFTPVLSRYRFVYAVFQETTATAIEACEAAWSFYGGVFHVLIPDNTKAIVTKADPLDPTFNETFLEYAQARGFVIDAARARKPTDKARVERTVLFVRDDCYGGEHIRDLAHAQETALVWCRPVGRRRRPAQRAGELEATNSQCLPQNEAALPSPGPLVEAEARALPRIGEDRRLRAPVATHVDRDDHQPPSRSPLTNGQLVTIDESLNAAGPSEVVPTQLVRRSERRTPAVLEAKYRWCGHPREVFDGENANLVDGAVGETLPILKRELRLFGHSRPRRG